MKPVNDPALIAQLEGGKRPVTDPRLIALLEGGATGGQAQAAPEMAGGTELQPYDPNSSMRRPAEAASGFNKGLAGVLGVPVDVASWGLRKAGVDIPAAPVGGSDYFMQQLADAGMIGAPTDRTGRVIERVGQELGATALPVGGLLTAASRTQKSLAPVPGLVTQMVNATRAAPGAMTAADAGLATTSGLGAAAAREIAPGNPTAELAGQLAGGFGPAALAGGARALFRGGETGRQVVAQNLDTFTRANVDPTVGQATGRPSIQAFENAMSKAPGGVGPMRKAAQQAAEQLKGTVNKVASTMAPQASAEQAGRTISRGIEGFTERFRFRSDQMYEQLDRFIGAGDLVDASQTTKTLKALTSPIEGAENLSGVLSNRKIAQIAEAFQADAASGELPYRALKELRSVVGRALSDSELVTEAPRAQMKQLYRALSADMARASQAAGPQAARAFERANGFYRSGMKRIDDTLQSLANKGAEPEKVFIAATRGKEGASTIRKLRRSVTPDEWDTVASTLLRRMGRARPSQQDDLGEAFSVETYLTNWNSLSDEAKNVIFGGERYRQIAGDLDAIAKSASGIREASRTLANPSGTAGQLANQSAGMLAGGALLAGDATIPLAIAGVAATNNAASRALMTNPKFIRWLAVSTKIPAERLPGHIGRLSGFMRNEDTDTRSAAVEYLNLFGE